MSQPPDAAPEPYDEGMLDVSDGNEVYWQVRGTPGGRPVVILHGGPGGSFARDGFRSFDRAGYQVVLFDRARDPVDWAVFRRPPATADRSAEC
jgi:pimeloyl-ACP methyl ester carboxylesterase